MESQNEGLSFSGEIFVGDSENLAKTNKKSFTMNVLDQIQQHKIIHSHDSMVVSNQENSSISNENSSAPGTPHLN